MTVSLVAENKCMYLVCIFKTICKEIYEKFLVTIENCSFAFF